MSFFWDAMGGAVSLLGSPELWLYVLGGALFGTFMGAMPGFGNTLAYALVVPFTFALDAVTSVTMLLAISVGVQYGNSLPAVLIGVPGTPAAMLTVLDGHALYKRGEGGLALGASYLGALVAQILSIPLFVAMVVPLADLAYAFQPPELFALYALGMVAIVSLTGTNMLKGLVAAALGLLVGLVGLDPLTSRPRFTFGASSLRSGLDEVAVVIGILAVGEIFRAARQVYQWGGDAEGDFGRIRLPKLSRFRASIPALLGGTLIGTFLGAVPGAGATPAALISYQQAQLWSKRPEDFGKGSVPGIMANESAQNASNSGELVPTLALGIPGSGSMLLLLSALTIQGLIPGPFLITQSPELLHAAIAGLLGGAVVLIVLGLKIAGLMLRTVSIDRSYVLMTGLALVTLGVWALHGRLVDVVVMLIFGVVGYVMYRYGYSPAAAALAVILSDGFERNLRQGLSLTNDSWLQFATRPVTGFILIVALALLLFGLWKQHRTTRRIREDDAVSDASSTHSPAGDT